jgi:hypothetical protein
MKCDSRNALASLDYSGGEISKVVTTIFWFQLFGSGETT